MAGPKDAGYPLKVADLSFIRLNMSGVWEKKAALHYGTWDWLGMQSTGYTPDNALIESDPERFYLEFTDTGNRHAGKTKLTGQIAGVEGVVGARPYQSITLTRVASSRVFHSESLMCVSHPDDRNGIPSDVANRLIYAKMNERVMARVPDTNPCDVVATAPVFNEKPRLYRIHFLVVTGNAQFPESDTSLQQRLRAADEQYLEACEVYARIGIKLQPELYHTSTSAYDLPGHRFPDGMPKNVVRAPESPAPVNYNQTGHLDHQYIAEQYPKQTGLARLFFMGQVFDGTTKVGGLAYRPDTNGNYCNASMYDTGFSDNSDVPVRRLIAAHELGHLLDCENDTPSNNGSWGHYGKPFNLMSGHTDHTATWQETRYIYTRIDNAPWEDKNGNFQPKTHLQIETWRKSRLLSSF